jgi:hypothetical protein
MTNETYKSLMKQFCAAADYDDIALFTAAKLTVLFSELYPELKVLPNFAYHVARAGVGVQGVMLAWADLTANPPASEDALSFIEDRIEDRLLNGEPLTDEGMLVGFLDPSDLADEA